MTIFFVKNWLNGNGAKDYLPNQAVTAVAVLRRYLSGLKPVSMAFAANRTS